MPSNQPQADHVPVLLHETLDALQVVPGKWYLDGTFGRGGHTREILARGGKVFALDIDQAAIEYGEKTFAKEIAAGNLVLQRENFENLTSLLETRRTLRQIGQIDGMLFDFGTSSDQLLDEERGFSFSGNAPLDMRMDDRLGVQAKDLLAVLGEKQLAQLFIEYGGEHEAKHLAKEIVAQRAQHPIEMTQDLVELILRTKHERLGHLHPATKVFQALRIAVNRELDVIHDVLPQALTQLAPGGRLVMISFHEGEDRLVKQAFRGWQQQNKGINVWKDVITASPEELAVNPRARSAKLRAFEKSSSS